MTPLLLILYLTAPAAVIGLCRKYSFFSKIGPVLILYLIGIIIGNLGIIDHQAHTVQDMLVTVIVPLAIPMMLFSCDFLKWNIKKALLTLITGILAVVISIIAGYFLFKPFLAEGPFAEHNLGNIAGMLAGVYTGGTPNLAAIKIMLNIPNETYIMVHSYDMAISLVYLTFVLSVGIKLFRKILPVRELSDKSSATHKKESYTAEEKGGELTGDATYRDYFTKRNLKQVLPAFAVSLLIFAVAGGLSLLLPSGLQMVVVILTITTLGIAASFIKSIRSIKSSYDTGMYLVYIFSIVVASMADLGSLNLRGGFYILLLITFVIFGSLILHLIMARILKIDSDSVLIASVSLINSPPFVPLVASAMKNKDVIITGLTIGLVGYALGNYLGYIISLLL